MTVDFKERMYNDICLFCIHRKTEDSCKAFDKIPDEVYNSKRKIHYKLLPDPTGLRLY